MRALNRSARIAETSTSTGAGDFTLAGALTGCKPFSVVGSTSPEWLEYLIEAVDGAGMPTGEWEAGLGLYGGANVLSRVLVQGSSAAGGGRIAFSAGTKVVSLTRLSNNLDPVHVVLPHGGDATAVTATTLITWRPTRNLTLSAMRASLATASSSGGVTLDLRVNGVSILSTLETILQGSRTSVGGTDAVFADPDLTPEDEVTVVCTSAGTGAAGLRVTLVGQETPVPFMDGLSLRLTPEDMRPFHTRASVAWAFNAAGQLQQYAANELRVVPSPAGVLAALREPQATNKCTNTNANPTTTAGVGKGGDAASTLTVVNDAAALASAGLGVVCSNGNVFRLDNSAGTGAAFAVIGGTTANTNIHTLSVFARVVAGGGRAEFSSNGTGPVAFSGAAFQRYSSGNNLGTLSNQQVQIRAEPGAVIHFILNQLEELPFATTPIVVAGSAVTRARDEINVPMSVPAATAHSQFMDFVIASIAAQNNRLTGDNAMGAAITSVGLLQLWNGVQTLNSANSYPANTRGKGAWAGDGAGRSQAMNGGAVATDANTYGALTRTLLGQLGLNADGQAPALFIHEFRTHRTRLVDNKLRRITA